MHRKVIVVTATLVLLASAIAGVAESSASAANAGSGSYVIRAVLVAKNQVPTPKDAASAHALLTGKFVLAGKKSSFIWKLSFSNLSGRAVAANMAMGIPGKVGALALPLCTKCAVGVSGSYRGPYVANPTFVKALLHGGMYAFIATKLNPKGEVRGQIKATSA